MPTKVAIFIVMLIGGVIYFLSSGIAFALMYRVGDRFPKKFASTFYAPLESLSRRSGVFRSLYNGFQAQCYRLLVGELVNDWVPPPPGLMKELEDVARSDKKI